MGNICWWNGPYEPRDWNDEMIFKNALAKNLEEYGRCKMDWGYRMSARASEMSRWFAGRSGSVHEGNVSKGEESTGNGEGTVQKLGDIKCPLPA